MVSFAALTATTGSKRVSTDATVKEPVLTLRLDAPFAFTCELSPIEACVFFVTTGTAAAAPTAAVPPALMLPPTTLSFSASSAETRTLPSALTIAPVPGDGERYATVVTSKTETPTLTFTAAVPPKPPPTAIDVTFSVETASTVTSPVEVTVTPWSIHAFVVFSTTSTSTPAPTPAVPPIVSVPAIARMVVLSVASTCASVLFVSTSTTTEPATPASPPPAPPTATSVRSSDCRADTVRPAPPVASMLAFAPIQASTTPSRTRMTAEAPTPAVLPKATLPEASARSVVSAAATSSEPPLCTVALWPIEALVAPPLSFSTTTRIDPATPALVDAPPATTSSNRSSVVVAAIFELPPAWTSADGSIAALTSLLITSTITETPTPALPFESESAPATFTSSVSSSAVTVSFWSLPPAMKPGDWLMRAATPMNALVVNENTSTTNAPVTAAVPPPTAPPTAIDETAGRFESSFSDSPVSGTIGSRVVLAVTLSSFAASTCVWLAFVESIEARVVTVRTLTA